VGSGFSRKKKISCLGELKFWVFGRDFVVEDMGSLLLALGCRSAVAVAAATVTRSTPPGYVSSSSSSSRKHMHCVSTFVSKRSFIKLGLVPDLAAIRAPTRSDEFTALLNFHSCFLPGLLLQTPSFAVLKGISRNLLKFSEYLDHNSYVGKCNAKPPICFNPSTDSAFFFQPTLSQQFTLAQQIQQFSNSFFPTHFSQLQPCWDLGMKRCNSVCDCASAFSALLIIICFPIQQLKCLAKFWFNPNCLSEIRFNPNFVTEL
jgi:hypothetical protein